MKNGTCVKCGHREVIRSCPAEYIGNNAAERSMCVTAEMRWVFGGRKPQDGHGVLELYTCRKCGYSEWYALDPADIPIGPEYKTRLVHGHEGG